MPHEMKPPSEGADELAYATRPERFAVAAGSGKIARMPEQVSCVRRRELSLVVYAQAQWKSRRSRRST